MGAEGEMGSFADVLRRRRCGTLGAVMAGDIRLLHA
jgi:hypothetical protein